MDLTVYIFYNNCYPSHLVELRIISVYGVKEIKQAIAFSG